MTGYLFSSCAKWLNESGSIHFDFIWSYMNFSHSSGRNKMDKIILYCCLLCYSIIMSETSAYETTGCNVSIEQSKHADIPPVILESEQSYYSNTNGKSFRRVPKFVGSIQLNASIDSGSFRFEVSRLRTHTVMFAYNGTHICSSAQLRLETDTC